MKTESFSCDRVSTVRRTSTLTLTVWGAVGLIAGRGLPVAVDVFHGTTPRVGWAPAWTMLIGAAIVGAIAWKTWQALHKRHQRMTSDHGIKMLALGKAAAIVGVLFAAGYAGFALAFIGEWQVPLGRERVIHGGAAAVTGLLLMAAGLLLERACKIRGDDDEQPGSGASSTDISPT